MPEFDFDYSVENHIATITFNRPDVLNALTLQIYAQFRDLLYALRTEDDVRVVVLTGEGRAFCSGGDVHEIIGALLDADMRAHLDFTRMTGAVVRNMRQLDKPIIAAINGTAAGAGAVIALASDIRIVSERAKFVFLFNRVGLTGADMGAAYLLPRIVGAGRATEILMIGDDVSARTAERIGLANRLTPPEQLMDAARELALRLANGPTFAISMTKKLITNEWSMDLVSALESEAQAQALMMMGEDHRRFYEAFNEKRAPEFRGR
ncbi:MAG: enoyl-CoA hydratase family protein [Anaerolineales bacterium]